MDQNTTPVKSTKRRAVASSASNPDVQAYLVNGNGVLHPPYPTQSHGSPAVDTLDTSFQRLATSTPVEGETDFDDTSESVGQVYFRLVSNYRVNISLYNKAHETQFRPRLSPAVSRRSSPTGSRTAPASLHSSLSGLAMNPTEVRAKLLPSWGVRSSASADSLLESDAIMTEPSQVDLALMSSSSPQVTKNKLSLWKLAHERTERQIPKLALDEVVGLSEIKTKLEEMTIMYANESFRQVFVRGSPPERTLYVRSDKGSGIHTLVNAICKRSGVNLIRVNYGVEPHWDDKLFVALLDFASAVQPVMIFFDRCDSWFAAASEGYRARGDKLILALQSHEDISSRNADVMFVVSNSTPMAEMADPFKQLIRPFREVTYRGMTEAEAGACLAGMLLSYANSLEKAVMEKHAQKAQEYEGLMTTAIQSDLDTPKYYEEVFGDIRRQSKEGAQRLGKGFTTFTPAMLKELVNKAVDIARNRELKRAAASGEDCDLINLVPLEADLTAARDAVRVTPGSLVYKSTATVISN